MARHTRLVPEASRVVCRGPAIPEGTLKGAWFASGQPGDVGCAVFAPDGAVVMWGVSWAVQKVMLVGGSEQWPKHFHRQGQISWGVAEGRAAVVAARAWRQKQETRKAGAAQRGTGTNMRQFEFLSVARTPKVSILLPGYKRS